MSFFNWINRKPVKPEGKNELNPNFTKGGIEFSSNSLIDTSAYEWLHDPGLFANWEAVAILGQLESEGLAVISETSVLVSWLDLFEALEQVDYSNCANLLLLPSQSSLQIQLSTIGSISDKNFQLILGWYDQTGRPLTENIQRIGAVILFRNKQLLLSKWHWQLVEEIAKFANRSEEKRNQIDQEYHWANIRQLAKKANVKLDRYLDKTIIISANQLEISLRLSDFFGEQVVELQPFIPGIDSQKWLNCFDAFIAVQNHYDLNTSDNERIRILLEPDAKAVLQEIKKMPKRRVSGIRAENFLRNPFALLGETMSKVISPESFERARDKAGLHLYDFESEVIRIDTGHIKALKINLNGRDEFAPAIPSLEIDGRRLSKEFILTFESALENGAACFKWGNNKLEIRGEAQDQIIQLKAWLCEAWIGESLISYSDIYDLSKYAPRVESIGVHKPQYVPYLARKDVSGGWLPENLEFVVEFKPKGGESILIPVTSTIQETIKDWLVSNDSDEFISPDFPVPISKNEARELLSSFQLGLSEVKNEHQNKEFNLVNKSATSRNTLNIRQNVEQLDYSEERSQSLEFDDTSLPMLSSWIKSNVQLKPHQNIGIAWLQHLWFRQDIGVRGALLADEMGLGKTLQLLGFIAWYLENSIHIQPVLVVAPVSLLENWQDEIIKFFDNRLNENVLALYGKSLKERKVNLRSLDEDLIDIHVKGFLRPDWLGNHKLVLTTYETLRDLEFSFASVKWSIMICDEAQKIKTPGALMTHAAKAQNAQFKIACTGTPVENSLADLWCLFDFIQPGLLKSLSEFCRLYRKPIESKTDEDDTKLDELRKIIEPQVLRRMKYEVADLPEKVIDDHSKSLILTNYQHHLYEQATQKYKFSTNKNDTGILGLLHRLRSICADPKDSNNIDDISLKEHCERSPKLLWLISKITEIQMSNEKVIIFTEFKDLQRMIQFRIREYFGFSPVIVNGSTKVGSDIGVISRQSLINAFQEKSGFGVIILSTTAVGFGVNIQAANHVIHFTRAWNPAKEDQATDRAYRIGQTKKVHLYYPTVISDKFQTFENRLDILLEYKRQIASDMLNGAGEIDLKEWEGVVL